jgi:ribonucleoside-diphosphate reductase alpha chain
MKRRGGVGFDLSNLRPKGQPAANAARTTDGIAVFMSRFSNTCREVAQGGRRGALMLTLDIRHPEVETFINVKRDKTKVTGANVSVRVTDEFMQAVVDDSDFTLRWPVTASPEEASIKRTIRARAVWEQLIDAAWSSAEPGILFWDTSLRMSPADAYTEVGFGSISTNPCSELILSKNDSCRLMVVNMAKFVKNPWTPTCCR